MLLKRVTHPWRAFPGQSSLYQAPSSISTLLSVQRFLLVSHGAWDFDLFVPSYGTALTSGRMGRCVCVCGCLFLQSFVPHPVSLPVLSHQQPRTPLEQEIFGLLHKTQQPITDPLLTPQEKASLQAMSLEEVSDSSFCCTLVLKASSFILSLALCFLAGQAAASRAAEGSSPAVLL